MRHTALLVAVLCLAAAARAQQFTTPVSVTDGATTLVLYLGAAAGATNGYDPRYDTAAPPPPPAGAFDARTRLGTDDFTQDIRSVTGFAGTFELRYQSGTGNPPVLHWDPATLGGGPGAVWTITDRFDGTHAAVDMRSTTTLATGTNPFLADGLVIRVTVPLSAGGTPQEELPLATGLGQNYPNPFNPATVIPFTLAEPGAVTLRVYDEIGRLVATLVEERKEAGRHTAVWDARNVASGVYLCEMRSGGVRAVRKLTLLK